MPLAVQIISSPPESLHSGSSPLFFFLGKRDGRIRTVLVQKPAELLTMVLDATRRGAGPTDDRRCWRQERRLQDDGGGVNTEQQQQSDQIPDDNFCCCCFHYFSAIISLFVQFSEITTSLWRRLLGSRQTQAASLVCFPHFLNFILFFNTSGTGPHIHWDKFRSCE